MAIGLAVVRTLIVLAVEGEQYLAVSGCAHGRAGITSRERDADVSPFVTR